MKVRWMILAGAFLGAGSLYAAATPICPTTTNNSSGADPTGCGVLITFGTSGSPTVTITGTGAYDGSEDATVGVINNSTSAVSKVTLTASDSSDAFGFDDDGIQTFTANNGVAIGTGGATGYEGPTSTFNTSGVDLFGGGTLVVNFSPGIAAGGNSYFSLEGDPATAGGGITVGGSTPEPGTFGALGAGLLGLLGMVRYRRVKK